MLVDALSHTHPQNVVLMVLFSIPLAVWVKQLAALDSLVEEVQIDVDARDVASVKFVF